MGHTLRTEREREPEERAEVKKKELRLGLRPNVKKACILLGLNVFQTPMPNN